VNPKPNKIPQLQRSEPKGNEGLVMIAMKGELKELSEPNAIFFVLLYKDNFFPLSTYPLLCQVLFSICYRNMKMCFPRKYHQGCHQGEELNTKLTLFLELPFLTVHHTAPTRRKQNKFCAKCKSSSTKGM
jgi:hypothetical protein